MLRGVFLSHGFGVRKRKIVVTFRVLSFAGVFLSHGFEVRKRRTVVIFRDLGSQNKELLLVLGF